jgi:alpha-glucosidase
MRFDLVTLLKAAAAIGPGNILRSVPYALGRDRADQRFAAAPTASEPVRIGRLVSCESVANGSSFRFEAAGLEVVFLAPDIVRLTFEPGLLPLPYAIDRVDWGDVPVAMRSDDRGVTLSSPELSVVVARGGEVRFELPSGAVLRSDLPPERVGERWIHRSALAPEEHVYGLGQRASGLNLRPGTYRTWNREPMGRMGPEDDPLYLGVPVFMGLTFAGSYLAFFENSHPGEFHWSDGARISFDGGALRHYFIPGPPPRALDRYTQLTGRAALPPFWALGYHQCRWSYRTQQEVRDVADGFANRNLPVSAIHLDIDYMKGYRVFTVDPARFPDLPGLARELDRRGIRLVAILDPGVKCDGSYEVYRDGCSRDVFVKTPDGHRVKAPVWPGTCVFPDFTSPRVREWWASHYRKLVEWGISGVWHDMNEPAAFAAWGAPTLPTCTVHDMDGRTGNHAEAHNLYALLEARSAHEGLRAAAPDRRPWILSRSGWAGLQRYAWNWTGDCESNWWTVRQSIRLALGLSLSGIPYTGPDIGGFSGKPSAELYVRWFQAASFLPFFRTHSAAFTDRREPWSFGPEALEQIRPSLLLRYRLLPYWYTAAWQASRTGTPLVRPMFWESPGDSCLWDLDDQFFVGDHLIVAPVWGEGQRERVVRLPDGDWYELRSGVLLEGGREVVAQAPLTHCPVFVRAGAVVPTQEAGACVLTAFVPRQGAVVESLFYSDAGDGYGPWRCDRFTVRRGEAPAESGSAGTFAAPDPDAVVVRREEAGHGQHPASPWILVLHGGQAVSARADGRSVPARDGRVACGHFGRLTIRQAG